ncbi:Elongator complex protein 4 [Yarrowia sp. B02]|nr:Elongator complex protein 4 [Yarrowia sp. B02]
MSFQKKNVAVPNRAAVDRNSGSPQSLRGPPAGSAPHPSIPGRTPRAPPTATTDARNAPNVPQALQPVPNTKPSLLQSSTPTVSSGCFDFDKLLGHNGIPTGTLTLLQEESTTDYASILIRMFAAQGCIDRRNGGSEVAVVGANDAWGRQLPGESDKKSRSRDPSSKAGSGAMKIAWRYGFNSEVERKEQLAENNTATFDLTKRLGGPEISKIRYLKPDKSIVAEIKKLAATAASENSILRVCIPTFLHPAIYDKQMADSDYVIGLFTQLRALTREYKRNLVIIVSLPLVLYPKSSPLTRWMEILADCVLDFFPFDVKVQEREFQGLVNVSKLPCLSDRGHMLVTQSEYAFRVTKRTFEIDEWSIPVEEDEGEKKEDALAF